MLWSKAKDEQATLSRAGLAASVQAAITAFRAALSNLAAPGRSCRSEFGPASMWAVSTPQACLGLRQIALVKYATNAVSLCILFDVPDHFHLPAFASTPSTLRSLQGERYKQSRASRTPGHCKLRRAAAEMHPCATSCRATSAEAQAPSFKEAGK